MAASLVVMALMVLMIAFGGRWEPPTVTARRLHGHHGRRRRG